MFWKFHLDTSGIDTLLAKQVNTGFVAYYKVTLFIYCDLFVCCAAKYRNMIKLGCLLRFMENSIRKNNAFRKSMYFFRFYTIFPRFIVLFFSIRRRHLIKGHLIEGTLIQKMFLKGGTRISTKSRKYSNQVSIY